MERQGMTRREPRTLALAAFLAMCLSSVALLEPPARVEPVVLHARGGLTLRAGEETPGGAPQTLDPDELLAGKLLLIDGGHGIPDGVPAPNARGVDAMTGHFVPARADSALGEETIYALAALVAGNPDAAFRVGAGARSAAQQQALRRVAFDAYAALVPLEEALALSRRDVPDPGHSEHQTAYAFDVELLDDADTRAADPLAGTPTGRWLLENAWRFGFIRRYPPGKAAITGVTGEQTHFRHVGFAHAAAMYAGDLCLEEYLALLRAHGTLTLYDGDRLLAVIHCLPQDGELAVPVPDGARVEASYDNTGWAVAAVVMPEETIGAYVHSSPWSRISLPLHALCGSPGFRLAYARTAGGFGSAPLKPRPKG